MPLRRRLALRLAASVALLPAGACAGRQAFPSRMPPMVFVHGFKGGTLVGPEGELGWLSGRAALGWQTPSLRLPLAWDGELQRRDAWRPGAPLRQVTVVPWLLEESVYAPWLDAAESWGYPIYPFTYDWRRDNLESLTSLTAHVEAVRQRHGGGPVRLVAHSMGGLISLPLINAHPEYFHDVIFAGVPFRGGSGFLPDLHVGTAVARNEDLLSPAVVFSFPAAYGFFDLEGTGLAEADGRPRPIDWFSAAAWADAGLGLFAPQAARPAGLTDAELTTFLQRALTRARQFRALQVATTGPYPPILVILARNRPTYVTAWHGGPRSVRGWDFDSAPRELGDGRVAERFALPPDGIPFQRCESLAGHVELLGDPVVHACLRARFARLDGALSSPPEGPRAEPAPGAPAPPPAPRG